MRLEINEDIKKAFSASEDLNLTRETKIEIVKRAKEIYLEELAGEYGMCLSISDAFRELVRINVNDDRKKTEEIFLMFKYASYGTIPELNVNNLVDLSIKHEFTAPKKEWLWWDVKDTESRAKAFDALIEQLSSQEI
jgi:hypothetical protein